MSLVGKHVPSRARVRHRSAYSERLARTAPAWLLDLDAKRNEEVADDCSPAEAWPSRPTCATSRRSRGRRPRREAFGAAAREQRRHAERHPITRCNFWEILTPSGISFRLNTKSSGTVEGGAPPPPRERGGSLVTSARARSSAECDARANTSRESASSFQTNGRAEVGNDNSRVNSCARHALEDNPARRRSDRDDASSATLRGRGTDDSRHDRVPLTTTPRSSWHTSWSRAAALH